MRRSLVPHADAAPAKRRKVTQHVVRQSSAEYDNTDVRVQKKCEAKAFPQSRSARRDLDLNIEELEKMVEVKMKKLQADESVKPFFRSAWKGWSVDDLHALTVLYNYKRYTQADLQRRLLSRIAWPADSYAGAAQSPAGV